MAIKPIALSFKNNKEDIELYEWIASHSNMSGFLKDTLRAVKNMDKNNKSVKDDNEKQLIDMDF